ncbi:unnamed protein product [Agarophyton chilense]
MAAFITPSFVGARTSSFTSSVITTRPALKASSRRFACTPVMASDEVTSIDFSKVNINTAGENFAGLVFTPESETDAVVKTRVDVGYTAKQEDAVNRHINVEYTAMYAYHAIWAYFDRDTVALPGFAHYFNDQSAEERDHAQEFMTYQNRRGGTVQLQPIAVPEMKFTMEDGTSDAIYAMDLHLQLEKFVYHKLIDLHKVAGEANDPQMQDFVEHYLTHQIEAIKKAADYVAQLKRVDTPHGVYHIDLTLRE